MLIKKDCLLIFQNILTRITHPLQLSLLECRLQKILFMYNLLTKFVKQIVLKILTKLNIESDSFLYFVNKIRYPFMNAKTVSNKKIISSFSKLFYNQGKFGGTWDNTFWFGTKTLKSPLDLWVYQEIINDIKPDIIIETGTAYGGSTLYLASILDLLGKGSVITIDVTKLKRPKHKRIKYLRGSSVSPKIVEIIKMLIKPKSTVMVILDSDHTKDHVLKEMEIYSNFISVNSYLIVEDGNVNGHPVWKSHGPGPYEAIMEFFAKNKSLSNKFLIDKSKEKYLISFNTNGFLKRIK